MWIYMLKECAGSFGVLKRGGTYEIAYDSAVLLISIGAAEQAPGPAVPFETGVVTWGGDWQFGLWEKDTMVRDGEWLMVANKRTYDRPAPQSVGDPVYALPTDPTWTAGSGSGYVSTANDFVLSESGWLEMYSVYVTEISDSVTNQVFLGRYSDANPDRLDLLDSVVVPATVTVPGIFSISLSPIASLAGTHYLVGLISTNDADSVDEVDSSWAYGGSSQSGSPASGEWRHNNQHTVLRIHSLDSGSTDQSGNLEKLVSGSTVVCTHETDQWTYRLNIDPRESGGVWIWDDVERIAAFGSMDVGDSTDIVGTVPGAAPTAYSYLPAYWASNQPEWAVASGTIRSESSGGWVVDQDAYGGDILFHPAEVSSDWNAASLSDL